MKPLLSFALGLAVFFAASSANLLHAEDWTTTDGKVYQNVSVVKAEPDVVTIMHHDGGAQVPLATLPPDLQKRFNYDPATAKAAAEARKQAEADNAKKLQAEINQAHLLKQARLVAEDPRVQNGTISPTPASDSASKSSAAPVAAPTDAPATTDPTHHTADQLVDIAKRLKDDHPDDTHHSITFLKLVAHDLGPDPADPIHHSTDQLLGTDPLARP